MAEERKNFLKLCVIAVDVLPKPLRNFFCKRWFQKYNCVWGNPSDRDSSILFLAGDNRSTPVIPAESIKYNEYQKTKIENGKVDEWDTTLVSKVILFSGHRFVESKSEEEKSVESLRNLRNENFAHLSKASVSDENLEQIRVFISNFCATYELPDPDFEESLITFDLLTHSDEVPTSNLDSMIGKYILNIDQDIELDCYSVLSSFESEFSQKATLSDDDIVSFRAHKGFRILLNRIRKSTGVLPSIPRERHANNPPRVGFATEFGESLTKGLISPVLKEFEKSPESIMSGVACLVNNATDFFQRILDFDKEQEMSRDSTVEDCDSSRDDSFASGATTPRSSVGALHCTASDEKQLHEFLGSELVLRLREWTPCMLLMYRFMREASASQEVRGEWVDMYLGLDKTGMDLEASTPEETTKSAELEMADMFDELVFSRRVQHHDLPDFHTIAREGTVSPAGAVKHRFRFPSVWVVFSFMRALMANNDKTFNFFENETDKSSSNEEGSKGRNLWLIRADELIGFLCFQNKLSVLSALPSSSFVVFLRLSPLAAVVLRESIAVLAEKDAKCKQEKVGGKAGLTDTGKVKVDFAVFSEGLGLEAVGLGDAGNHAREGGPARNLLRQLERRLAVAAIALDVALSTPEIPPVEVLGRMIRMWIQEASKPERVAVGSSWITFTEDALEGKVEKVAQEGAFPRTVMSISAATTKTMSSYLRNVKGFTEQMRCQQDAQIPRKLALEAASAGLLTDRQLVGGKAKTLIVSDYVVALSSDDGDAFYRHQILGEWKAIRLHTESGGAKMDTSFVFYQDRDRCVFSGISDREKGTAEIGFGIQILEDSQEDSRFEVLSIECCGKRGLRLRGRTLKMEPILCCRRQEVEQEEEDALMQWEWATSDDAVPHVGPIRRVYVEVEGQPATLPIFRAMRSDPPPTALLPLHEGETDPIRGWLQLDPHETDEHRAGFSFRMLQALLAEFEAGVGWPLPELSGRWRLEEVSDYPGFSYYTVLAIPFPKDAADDIVGCDDECRPIQCMVVVLQSNDSEEFVYERIGVGRGIVTRPAASAGPADRAALSVTVRMVRLLYRFGGVENDLESLEGDPSLLRISTGSTLARLEPVSRPKTAPISTSQSPSLSAATPTANYEALTGAAEAAPRPIMNEQQWAFSLRLLEAFVPARLSWELAIQAGDLESVLQALEGGVDLWQPITLKCRIGKRQAKMIPLVGAALQVGGRGVLVDSLFERQREELVRRGDVHTLACVAPASVVAASALLQLLQEDHDAAGRACPKDHALCSLSMGGLSPMQIAAMAGARADLAAQMVHVGCVHNLATAVQTGDLAWLEARRAEWEGHVNERFPASGSTVQMEGFTPLLAATSARNLPLVQLLVNSKADIFLGRRNFLSNPIQYAQVYDQNEPQDFPIMRVILAEARRRRTACDMPEEWAGGFLDRCEFYRNLTHPAVWSMIEDFDLGLDEDCDGDGEVGDRGGLVKGSEEECMDG